MRALILGLCAILCANGFGRSGRACLVGWLESHGTNRPVTMGRKRPLVGHDQGTTDEQTTNRLMSYCRLRLE